ncbi:MAG TPA: alpha/beta hydrolase [Actinomycetota bacterium]|nr:alpha/beta hydrolase [Actinomycetota bacterium]
MRKRRAAIFTAGIAVSALAGGLATRSVLRRGRPDQDAHEDLSALPPDDLGFVGSFDGTKLAVRAAGDPANPMLVFVHGFSLDMTTWHHQWTGLSDRFRCVLFDLRSHGRSEPAASGDLSLSAMGRDVAAVVEATIGRRRAVVIGHSLGGMAVLAAAGNRPELFGGRVRGVALIGTAASNLLQGVMGSVTGLLRPRLGSLSQAADRVNRLRRYVVAGRGDVGALIARATQFGPDPSPGVVSHVVGLAARAPSQVWTDGLAGLMTVDVRDELANVTVPTLVAVGDHDRVTPPAAAMILVGDLPNARLEIVEGAGHLAMLERPNAVNDMLARFSAEVLTRRTTRKRPGTTT